MPIRARWGKWYSGHIEPDLDPPIVGIDVTGAWIEDSGTRSYAGVDGTGPWLEGVMSVYGGVDGAGPWIAE